MTHDNEEPSAASDGSPQLLYASVCDGIGAAHVAWQPLGWHCAWTAEIDAFPAAVVEQRWGFPNRGDMTKFNEWSDDGSSIDLLVGGTPCQSFSVAGLRKGLSDPRGGLMLTFLEIAQRHRPRWIVWENVPGVLSSGRGRDFGAFLGALGTLGYGWAYRVLDAQWFGVAQRRRRVFVVGCLGDERRAAQVLFESESVRRDNPPSRAKGQGATYDVAPCIGASGRGFERAGETRGQDPVIAQPIWRGGDQANSEHCYGHAGTLNCDKGQQGGIVAMPQAFYSTESRCDGIPEPDVSPPLKVGSNGGGQPPAVCFSAKDHGGDASEEVAPTMRSMGHDGSHANGGGKLAVCTPIDLRQASRGDKDTNNRTHGSGGPPGHGVGDEGDPAFTVSERGQAVAFKPSHYTRGKDGRPSEVTPPLSADADKGDQDTVIAAPFVKAKRAQSTIDDESLVPGEVAPTFNCFDQGDTRATTVVAFANRTRDGIKVPEVMKDGVTPALTNQGDGGRSDAVNVVVPAAQAFTHSGYSNKPAWITGDRTDCLPSSGHGDTSHQGIGVMTPIGLDFQNCANTGDVSGTLMGEAQKKGGEAGHGVWTPMAVRRLTPRECERLQGFPDDYTAIEYRKKPAADGPRYKALGNSMAVPVMAWIGRRIAGQCG